jgi:predicted dinucleotide-binding enzyme
MARSTSTGSRLVKAFNTMYYETLRTEGRPSAPEEERLALFVVGADGEAKAVVSRLIEEVGFAPVDTGSLSDGRKQEPGSPIHRRWPVCADAGRGWSGKLYATWTLRGSPRRDRSGEGGVAA